MLTVLGYSGKVYTNRDKFVLVRCDCGIVAEMRYPTVKNQNRSCGCRQGCYTHGLSDSPIYEVWRAMRQRCGNPNDPSYQNYGGRGIKVCRRWNDFSAFHCDMLKSYADGLVIDRIDNNKDYMKSNCRWVTRAESNRNMRTNRLFLVEGRALCFAEVVRAYGQVKYRKALHRLTAGWPVLDAIGTENKSLEIRRL